MKKKLFIILIILIMVLLSLVFACYYFKWDVSKISDIFCNDKCQIDKFVKNKELTEEIFKNIELKPNYTIKNYEWIDDEHTCFRVRLGYKNKPEDVVDEYSGDYFFIIKDNKVQQVIFSDYSNKDILSNGEHTAHFEDVTFDGNKDLIVSLRCGTANCFDRAYIFNNGKYEYAQSFEEIPNYKINQKNLDILGISKDSACNYTYYHYDYYNVKFNKKYEYVRNICLEQEILTDAENLKNNVLEQLKKNPDNKDLLFNNYLSDLEKLCERFTNNCITTELSNDYVNDLSKAELDEFKQKGIIFFPYFDDPGNYAAIDYKQLYQYFHPFLSEAYSEYLKIKDGAKETNKFLDNPFDDLRLEIIKTDDFINKYPNFINISEIKEHQKRNYWLYEDGFFIQKIKCRNPDTTYDAIYNNDDFLKEVRDSYARFLKEYNDKQSEFYTRIKDCYELMTK